MDYQKDDKFNRFAIRLCSLSFVPTHMIKRALDVLQRRISNFDTERTKSFAQKMIQYIKDTWINGPYCIQDWNIFNIDCQVIPATNNGNEGTNSKLNKTFETHPQFYKFVLLVIEELDNSEEKVINILDGVTKPRETERTKELKEDREAQKKLLIERCDNPNATENDIDEDIDRFMGKTATNY